jgi:hypothetical protein
MVVYYIDYDNGSDTAPATNADWGTKTALLSIDSSADSTHFVDADLTGVDDYINGAYICVYVGSSGTIRGQSYITDFVATDDTATISPAITDMAADDTYYMIYSYKTIQKYTGSTRTVGDIGYVRANMTHTQGAANVTFDTDGTSTTRNSLIGCNATQGIDPWNDASDTRPIIDFEAGAYYFGIVNVRHWKLKNLNFRNTTRSSLGVVYLSGATGVLVENCVIQEQQHATGYGLLMVNTNDSTILDCTFVNNNGRNIELDYCVGLLFDNCTLDSGALGTDYGVSFTGTQAVRFKKCVFGGTSQHGTACVYNYAGTRPGEIIFTNCTFNGTKFSLTGSTGTYKVHEEDTAGLFGYQETQNSEGVITRCATGQTDTTVRSGGATSTAKMQPNANAGILRPLTISGDLVTPDFRIWCPASATTITIYMKAYGTWSPYPDASQLFIQAEYYTDDSPLTKALSTASTQVLSDTTTWVGFTTTFTPGVASWAYLKIYLGLYEDASTGIYIDPKVVIS